MGSEEKLASLTPLARIMPTDRSIERHSYIVYMKREMHNTHHETN